MTPPRIIVPSDLVLRYGAHDDPSEGMCAMEWSCPAGCGGALYPYACSGARCVVCYGESRCLIPPRDTKGRRQRQPIRQRLFGNVRPTEAGCWEFAGTRDGRSGHASIRADGRMRKAHVVAWELVFGSVPTGLCVCHRCDNPPCINPEHLFLGTVADNNRDRQQKGRTRGFVRSGPDHHAYRVTPEMVRRAHLMRVGGQTQREIADALDISRGHTAKILGGMRRA